MITPCIACLAISSNLGRILGSGRPGGRECCSGTDEVECGDSLLFAQQGYFCRVSLDGAVVQADKSGDQAQYGANVTSHEYWTVRYRFHLLPDSYP